MICVSARYLLGSVKTEFSNAPQSHRFPRSEYGSGNPRGPNVQQEQQPFSPEMLLHQLAQLATSGHNIMLVANQVGMHFLKSPQVANPGEAGEKGWPQRRG